MQELNDTNILTWPGLGVGAQGKGCPLVRTGDRVAQVFGDFAGASLLVEGSLDNEHWFQLRDLSGLALTFNKADGRGILESPPYVRPVVLGGSPATSLTVKVSIRKA